MKSLFEISAILKNELDQLTEGELLPDKIKEMSQELTSKVDNVAFYRQELLGYLGMLQDAQSKLDERIAFYEKKIERLDDYVKSCLDAQEAESFQGDFYNITKRKPVKVVEITNEKLIPIEFISIPVVKATIMKSELAKALKEGEVIDGARLVDGKISVQYKLK